MPDNRARRTFAPSWLVTMVWAFAALAAILWILGFVAHQAPLFPHGPNFEDITVYQLRFRYLFHRETFFTQRGFSSFAYPAGSAVVYDVFYSFADPVRAFLIFATVITILALAVTVIHLRRAAAAALLPPLLLLSFPYIFLIQRANIEFVLFALVAAGILAYLRGLIYVAAILFGLAAACKFYPIFLIGLFLRRRQELPAAITGVLTFLVALCASIAFAGPTFMQAAHGFSGAVGQFQDHYVQTVRSAEINYDHCLFSPFKYWSSQTRASLAPLLHPYYLIAGTLTLLLFLRVRTLPFLNRVVFLTTAMIALPPVSYTYTFTHLYLPALLLLCALARFPSSPTAPMALALLLFLFLPFVAIVSFGAIPAGPIQAFFVLALLIVPALTAWPSTIPSDNLA